MAPLIDTLAKDHCPMYKVGHNHSHRVALMPNAVSKHYAMQTLVGSDECGFIATHLVVLESV